MTLDNNRCTDCNSMFIGSLQFLEQSSQMCRERLDFMYITLVYFDSNRLRDMDGVRWTLF